MISPGIFFHFCEILIYWAVRGDREEGGGRGMRHISGTVKHIIMSFRTLVLTDDISRHCF